MKITIPVVQSTVATLMLCATVVVLQTEAVAQPSKKVPKIGYLTNDTFAVDAPRRNAFRQGLRDLGYVEGQSVTIEYRVGDGHTDKLAELADDLVRIKVDVIFAFTTPAAQAARKAANEMPIVMGASGDPVALGLVESLHDRVATSLGS